MPEFTDVVGPKFGASPLRYEVVELGVTDYQSGFAHYDGSAAGGNFLPALTIRSQNGTILSRTFPGTTVTAGDTADVSFTPLAASDSAAAGGGGIQFDVQNVGGWLSVETTSTSDGTATGVGMLLESDIGDMTLSADARDLLLFSGRDTKITPSRDLSVITNRDILLTSDGETDIVSHGDIRIHAGTISGLLRIDGLPTSNPGITGAIWNNAGTLMIA